MNCDDKNRKGKRFCCDMRGMLSFMLLFLLSKKEMSGQELADELEKRKGDRPSPGTIYPALKQLREHGLINERKDGKNIRYVLTDSGKKGFNRAKKHFTHMFGGLF